MSADGASRRRLLGMAAAGAAVAPGAAAASRPPGRSAWADARGVFDVTRFGASGDGRKPSTQAIQAALDACGKDGGGTVLVPPGRYLSGALFLRSHVRLHLSAGATLMASSQPEDFPPIDGRDEGIERKVHSSLLTGRELESVSVTGEGVLDGQGPPWWRAYDKTLQMRVDAKLPREAENPPGAPLRWPRPRLINLVRCHDVLVDGITLTDTPFYALHLLYCQNVVVQGVTTRQREMGHNTAIAIDSSQNIRISNCALSYGGDGIGIKAGYNEDGRRVGIASENILITNCEMSHGHAGVAIGSETAGNIRNVVVSNCLIHDTTSGVYIRGPRGRGGTVEQIHVSNLVLDRIEDVAIKVSQFFDSVRMDFLKGGSARRDLEIARSRKAPVDAGTPTFRNFVFSGVTMGTVGRVAVIEGLPERFIRGLLFENVAALKASGGFYCTLAADVSVSGLSVDTLESAVVDAREVEGLEVNRVRCAHPFPEAPAVWLDSVTGAFVHGCKFGSGGPSYQWFRQEQCQGVTLAANDGAAPPAPPKGKSG